MKEKRSRGITKIEPQLALTEMLSVSPDITLQALGAGK